METSTLGLLVGTSLLDEGFGESLQLETQPIDTRHGRVTVHRKGDLVVIQRHQSQKGYRAPHAINHKANLLALDSLNIERAVAINSTGSLSAPLEPGTLVIPDDFIDPWSATSYFDDQRGHGVARFDETIREQIYQSVNRVTNAVKKGGTYLQTNGPRFETPAEARMFANYADVIGMTAGSEVTLASELEIRYATLCSVDNYVNGITGTEIDLESFKESVEDQTPTILDAVNEILDTFDVTLEVDVS